MGKFRQISTELWPLIGVRNWFSLSIFGISGMQNGDDASSSIILAGRALLMKMLITLEPCGIFCSNFVYYMNFNIVQPLVCIRATMFG